MTATVRAILPRCYRLFLVAIAVALAAAPLAGRSPTEELKAALSVSGTANISEAGFARIALSRQDAKIAADMLLDYAVQQRSIMRSTALNTGKFTHDGYEMPFKLSATGIPAPGGRSLYISLHGGGNTAAERNDGQWRNQMRLYAPAEGVYFVPRAAVNDWNMWFQPHIDALFDMAIETAVTELGVNPDKVYLFGYSAGGDGVYRLAPRLADRWAAASMMAGHPGDVSPLNLRNTPFMIWMGANDSAYSRNAEAAKFGERLDALSRADTEGYRHETRIVAGKAHWMERVDTAALPWMAQFARNPLPSKIVWRQDDVPHSSFYWLSVPEGEAKQGRLAVVERKIEQDSNTFIVHYNDYESLTIGVNDEMIDFDKPVKIISGGRIVFDEKLKRTIADISESVGRRRDKRLIFSAHVTIKN
ncbi:MAG: alpha/beta hydrolase [Prevotellaceae bacterium]|jgi:poly(3-hydroxybutyrate) depolymerase|nr:alpha/beta hydrolase [Prevotellaceae bacterium]